MRTLRGSNCEDGEDAAVVSLAVWCLGDFGDYGDWRIRADEVFHAERMPGRLGVRFDGSDPVEVVVGGWTSWDPCCEGGHSALAAAPVVREPSGEAPLEWLCEVCGRDAEPEVWHCESVDRITAESPGADDSAARVEPEFSCAIPEAFVVRAHRMLAARAALKDVELESRIERAGENLAAALDAGEPLRPQLAAFGAEGTDYQRGRCRHGDDVVVVVGAPRGYEGVVAIGVQGARVRPAYPNGFRQSSIECEFTEVTPAQAALALLDRDELAEAAVRSLVLAPESPDEAMSGFLMDAWQKRLPGADIAALGALWIEQAASAVREAVIDVESKHHLSVRQRMDVGPADGYVGGDGWDAHFERTARSGRQLVEARTVAGDVSSDDGDDGDDGDTWDGSAPERRTSPPEQPRRDALSR